MIGLSVILCIRDIVINASVGIEEVEKILTGRKYPNEETLNAVILRYRGEYWWTSPDECERVFRQLLAEGKIEYRSDLRGFSPAGHWVKSEDEIELVDVMA